MDTMVATAVREILHKKVPKPSSFVDDKIKDMLILLRIHETPRGYCAACVLVIKHRPLVFEMYEQSINPMRQKSGNA